jgi:linoleoyl-CoA desaturase
LSTAIETRAPARATFPPHSDLRQELCQRVDAYFEKNGLDQRGGGHAILKTATILTWAISSYVLLVFFATSPWTAVPLGISLGLALTGIGFSVMHDGGHGATSHRSWVNRLHARSLDLMGASSFFWNQKHNIIHHTFTNVDGLDDDIDSRPFLRMGPAQERRWFHRFQHWYVIPLLVFFVPKWLLFDDWKTWATARIVGNTIPRPHGWEAVLLVLGKIFFLTWAFVIPLAFHPVLQVALAVIGVAWVLGVTLAMVFQLAHAVEQTTFTIQPTTDEPLEQPFFEHQLATTANFAPRNRLVSWYVGGLNYQVEHHLFPRISHLHYPAISSIVRDVCRERGIPYHCNDTVLAALRSHFRYLKRLGREGGVPSMATGLS